MSRAQIDKGRSKAVQLGNREWATAVVCVNSEGWNLPPFLLFQGVYHLANWYTETGLPRDWAIKTTSNGWTDNNTTSNVLTDNNTCIEWLKYFEKHTAARTKGAYRMLILDGHESYHSAEFETYCKEKNIITLCLPAHSSHLTQPLDIGFFSPLKCAYGKEINAFIRAHINHISKVEFLIVFKAAYLASIIPSNARAGFRGAGLIPFEPQAIISKLDIKLRTPTPTDPALLNEDSWTSQTPRNPKEALSQSTLLKSRIERHQGSSPTQIFEATTRLTKGMNRIAHELTLAQTELASLRKANEAFSKRRRAKKTRFRLGGALAVGDAHDDLESKEVDKQLQQEMRDGGNARAGANEANADVATAATQDIMLELVKLGNPCLIYLVLNR